MLEDEKEYFRLLKSLQKELSEREKNNRKKNYSFNNNQQSIYNFVMGRKSIIQLDINGKQFFMKKGTSKKGFMHILLRHYVPSDSKTEKEGMICANDILNISNVIRNGERLEEYEIKDDDLKDKEGYKQHKNGKKHLVILNKDKNGNWFITYYTDYELKKEENSEV